MTILCFHSVAPESSSTLTVSSEQFEGYCRWLKANRQVVPLATAQANLDHRFRPRDPMTAITFDDGWSGVYDHAWPILQTYDLPFTVFVIAETLVDPDVPREWLDNPVGAPTDMITLEQTREMFAAGVDIGSHSMRHDDLPSLGRSVCEKDLRDSKELLEDLLSAPIPTLAYPKGRHDSVVREAAKATGYSAAYSLPETREEVGQFSIPRVGIYPTNGVRALRIKTHPRYLDVRLHPVHEAVKAGKTFASSIGRG